MNEATYTSSERPEIEFTAKVQSKELRFDRVPETKVSFPGYPERDSVSGTERENLPEEVEENVTYQDSYIRLRIASKLSDAAIEESRG